MTWLQRLFRGPAAPASAAPDEPPPWVGDVLGALKKQIRVSTKHRAALEARLDQLETRLTPPEPVSHDELFDALDALEEALRHTGEPHLRRGLEAVLEKLSSFCERSGFDRASDLGEPPDPRLVRVVGTELAPGVPDGSVSRIVRAAITRDGRLVREGQVIVSARGEDE